MTDTCLNSGDRDLRHVKFWGRNEGDSVIESGRQAPKARSQASWFWVLATPEKFKEIGVKWCILRAIYTTFAHFF